jgi:hypothetical protein
MEQSTRQNVAQRAWDGGSQVNRLMRKIPPEQWPERGAFVRTVPVSATGVTSRYLCGKLAGLLCNA